MDPTSNFWHGWSCLRHVNAQQYILLELQSSSFTLDNHCLLPAILFLITVVWQMHAKGARHIAAVSRLKEKGLSRQDELNKRIALSSGSVTASSSPSIEVKGAKVQNQPLIEQTRKAILEIQSNRSWDQVGKPGSSFKNLNKHVSPCNSKLSAPNHVLETPMCASFQEPQGSREMKSVVVTETAGKMLADWNNEQHKRREKELKFIAAGWKRDGFGKWYKDENVSIIYLSF